MFIGYSNSCPCKYYILGILCNSFSWCSNAVLWSYGEHILLLACFKESFSELITSVGEERASYRSAIDYSGFVDSNRITFDTTF